MDILKVLRCETNAKLNKGEDGVYCSCGKDLVFNRPKYEGRYMVTCPKCNSDILFYTKGSEKINGE